MSRILFVAQETGGVGKSTIARALAEAVPDAPVYEIESAHRLIEIEDRVKHFPIRASRSDVVKSAGEAALAEYDEVINSILVDEARPAIVDIGANGADVLAAFGRMAPAFKRRSKELGVVVVWSAAEGAKASAIKLLGHVKPWASECFVVGNEYRGAIDASEIKKLAGASKITALPKFKFDEKVATVVEPLGLALIPSIDEDQLAEMLPDAKGNPNFTLADRVNEQLKAYRLAAMQAVRPAAEWLIG